MKKEKFYIKGLDEIRALASLGVLAHHIELYKFREGRLSLIEGLWGPFFQNLGKNCVFIFFCLSGFLITTLLLKEKKESCDINIRSFYRRRCARILPLYYGLTIFSFFVLPFISTHLFFQSETYYLGLMNKTEISDILLFLLVLPNVSLVLGKRIPGLSQSWSIGVEEQFYLIWPWVIKKIKENYLPLSLLILAVIKITFLNRISRFGDFTFLSDLIKQFALEYMAIGGIAGWIYFKQREFKFFSRLTSNHWLLFSIVFLVISFYFMFTGSKSSYRSFVYSLLILSVSNTNIRTKWVSDVGQKSYGIYMYHPMIIFLTSGLMSYLQLDFSHWGINFLFYFSVIIVTYMVSSLSFNYFESPLRRFFTNDQK